MPAQVDGKNEKDLRFGGLTFEISYSVGWQSYISLKTISGVAAARSALK